MARSRQRRYFRRGFSRTPGDWVYRPRLVDDEGAALDSAGSYGARQTITAGVGGSGGCILYDSHNFVQENVLFGLGNASITLPSTARAEGGTAKIIRVQGTIFMTPSTWTVGTFIQLGLRFGIWEQDPNGGSIVAPAAYSLWVNNPALGLQNIAAFWANTRAWQREFRVQWFFENNQQRWVLPFNFAVNRRLKPNECYALWTETQAGSATIELDYWLRTFVADEAGG